jgi:hypothetical protein
MSKKDQIIAKMEEIVEDLETMSNNYQVLNGCYVISKNVLDVFIEHTKDELRALQSQGEEEETNLFIPKLAEGFVIDVSVNAIAIKGKGLLLVHEDDYESIKKTLK